MRRYLLILFLLPWIFLSCSDTEEVFETFYLIDYGAVVDDPTHDNGPALKALLADVHKASQKGYGSVIFLPSGDIHVYSEDLESYSLYISNHDHHEYRKVAMMFDGLKNVELRGDSTHLQFHGTLIPIVINECDDVELKGFSIDYPRPTMTQIEIKEIDKASDQVLVDLLAETVYEIKGQELFVLTETDTISVPWSLPFAADGHMKWGRSDPLFNPRQIEEIAPHQLLLTGWGEIEHLQVGDTYVLRSPNRPTPGIVISDSKSIKVDKVTVHFADGMGLLAQSSTDIDLSNFVVGLRKGSPRRFTTIADATHFSGCRGHIESVDGYYENMADDAINVHGTYLRVDSIVGGKELYASFAHYQTFGIPWYEVGDTLALVSRETLMTLFTFIPSQVEVLSPKQFRVTLSQPIDAKATPLVLENLSAYPSVDFNSNTISNNRARGALFTTRRPVVCENNLFDHTHGSAILLTGDANGWFESGPCEDVLIIGNRFVNALSSRYQFTDGVISIAPQIAEYTDGAYYHGKVKVVNNVFDNYPVPLYSAKSVSHLIIEGNQYTANDTYPPLFEDTRSKYKHVGVLDTNEELVEE